MSVTTFNITALSTTKHFVKNVTVDAYAGCRHASIPILLCHFAECRGAKFNLL